MRRLIPVLLLFSALSFGCGIGGSGTNGTAGNSAAASGNSASKTAAAPAGDPRDAIIQAANKFNELPSFAAKMDTTGEQEMHIKMEYAAPDRYHVNTETGKTGSEMTVIGKDTYMKFGGQWRKMPGDLGSTIPSLKDSFSEEGMKNLNDVKLVGDDTVDGKAATVYSYKGATPKEGKPFNSKIWIGKERGLPIKIEVEYPDAPGKHMTVKYDPDATVTIEPPIK